MKMNSILIENVTCEELKHSLQDVIRDELKNLKTKESNIKYFTRNEVCEILKISLPTLHSYTKNGIIPGNKIGGRVLYKATDIDNALKKIESLKFNRG